MTMPTTPRSRTPRIGELWLGGDWACAHGDLAGLRRVAEQLCELETEPLRPELCRIADACTSDPDRAMKLWFAVRDRLDV